MRVVANFSGGKDSTAMVLMMIDKGERLDEIVYYETGADFLAASNVVDKVELLAREKNIDFTRLKPTRPFFYDMIEKPVSKRNGSFCFGYDWCGGCRRWGTTEKARAIEKHVKGDTNVVHCIGIAVDEQFRAKKDAKKRYPLIEYGMTEKDCLQYCYDNGVYWDEGGIKLYDILDRQSCWCCRNKNIKELRNMYLHLPKYWQKLRILQTVIKDPFYTKGKTIFDFENRFKHELLDKGQKPIIYKDVSEERAREIIKSWY